ncbi:histone H1-like isoform X3 [Phalaenopsis equestris]|uniref:histone H1-like isoform X3 n=1 Tax=Phalaenopsis equestris TaxID=78828 RepID=UPI0009E201B7|nr:histone H1-like isoform X3 [Phalaenopsis equestris]
MIKEAILDVHDKTGSSPHAIGKYMEEKNRGNFPENFRKLLAVQGEKKAAEDVKPRVAGERKKTTKEVSATAKRKVFEATKKGGGDVKGVKKAKVVKVAKVVKKVRGAAPAKPKAKSIKAPAANKAKKAAA